MSPTVLVVFAHPDDECLPVGGTLAQLASKGAHITLVCMTRGEVGEIADPSLATPETLATVRMEELRCATQTLGVAELIVLDYRDSGMVGTPANEDPRALIRADPSEVVVRLVEIIRRVQPQIVFTFDPEGGYGHPDHIATHQCTLAAFHAAADSDVISGSLPPWQASSLLYPVMSRTRLVEIYEQLRASNLELGLFSQAENNPRFGYPDSEIDFALDVSGTVELKRRAINCHRTQFGPDSFLHRLPGSFIRELLSREYFVVAWRGAPPMPFPWLDVVQPVSISGSQDL